MDEKRPIDVVIRNGGDAVFGLGRPAFEAMVVQVRQMFDIGEVHGLQTILCDITEKGLFLSPAPNDDGTCGLCNGPLNEPTLKPGVCIHINTDDMTEVEDG